LDATVAGASLAIRRGQVKKITAADIEEAKRAHARDRFLRMKEHRSVAPVEPNPAIPAIPVPMGEGEGRSRAEVVGEEDDDYLFNPARAMAVNRLIQPHLSSAVTRKQGKYGFIDDCGNILGSLFHGCILCWGNHGKTYRRSGERYCQESSTCASARVSH
jgi:hypothetical protein